MYNPVHIANNFLDRSFKAGSGVTQMKLQKMIYFLYRDYLKETGLPLFCERFEAWEYGPVLDIIYNKTKKYGKSPINKYLKYENKATMINEDYDPVLKRHIDDIWTSCLPFTGVGLSKITHKDGSAWCEAWGKNKRYLEDNSILNENIKVSI